MNLLKKCGTIFGVLAVLAFSFETANAQAAKPKTLQEVYQDAVKLYNDGEYKKALEGFQLVLEKQPKYIYARTYAVKCRTAIAQGGAKGNDLETQLAAIKIPSIDFNETDLGTIFEYLTQKTEELSGGKVAANIIYQGSTEDRDNKLVTLKLRDVPVTTVLEYVGRMSGTRFKYEKYAIVGLPAGAGGTETKEPVEEAQNKPKFDSTVPALPKDPFGKN